MSHRYRHEDVTAHYNFEGRFGRAEAHGLVLDECATSKEHLEAPTPEGKDRRDCRVCLDSLVPTSMLGRRGTWDITIRFVPDDPK